jgi:hypothetical protein
MSTAAIAATQRRRRAEYAMNCVGLASLWVSFGMGII